MKIIKEYRKLIICILISITLLCIGIFSSSIKFSFGKSYADMLCDSYGVSCFRVHNNDELKTAFASVINNHKSGEFHFISDVKKDSINGQDFLNWFNSKYTLDRSDRNYYTYAEKGEVEPFRFKNTFTSEEVECGDFGFEFSKIRITDAELTKTNYLTGRLKDALKGDGSDYAKILNSYEYILNTTTYITDNGFNDLIDSNTSIYDVFINRKSVCVGESIAFSYLMDMYGIKSYIVDVITYVNESKRQFESHHTYNIVELKGKYYRVDLTMKQFLVGVSASDIHGGNFNLSSTSYYPDNNESKYRNNQNRYDMNYINNVRNEAMKLNVKVTQRNVVNKKDFDIMEADEYRVDSPTYTTEATTKATNSVSTTSYNGPSSSEEIVIINPETGEKTVIKPGDGTSVTSGGGDTTSTTSKQKYINIFTSVVADNNTTKVINYRVEDNGEFTEISAEEAAQIKESNDLYEATRNRNNIIMIAILVVIFLILIQLRKKSKRRGTFSRQLPQTIYTFNIDK